MTREYLLQPFRAPIQLRIDYARELNEQQYAAVTAPPGPSLVIAGAGSGKTRALTYRVAFLIEQGIPPERILLLTFTNKAAREMMRRVAELLGQELATLWGGTFHAIGNRLLRQHARQLGYEPDFTILDRDDSKHFVSTCVAESGIDIKATRFPKSEVLAELFSLAVNKQVAIGEVLAEEHSGFSGLAHQIEKLHRSYTARKLAANSMDFDDLLVRWLELLNHQEDLRDHYQKRFQFILVDEYQDTNKLQGDLIDLLAARHQNVMVVGDDAQSIYAWRGANFRNILDFPKRYPGARVFRIETNYRSTPEILKVANAAITRNIHQFSKELAPSRQPGIRPILVACADARQQAVFVAQRALELREEGVDLNRMAVLYRSHFHALELQLELTQRNIPFSITSGIRFFEQAHIKDVTAYLKLVVNPRDELAFLRLVQMLRGIGGKGALKLWKAYSERLEAAGEQKAAARAISSCSAAVPKKSAGDWAQFSATVGQLEDPGIRRDASKMITLVLEAGYDDYLEETFANYRSRREDLEELAVFARQFEAPEDFLTQLALLTSVEAEDEKTATREDEQLRLSTIHQAKGLEFDVVFIIMLCEGLFPAKRSLEVPEGEEEERRLMYVAITRARNELYLSYPLVRGGFDGKGEQLQQASRFLSEIPGELREEWNLRAYG